jgi:hypothetical protein
MFTIGSRKQEAAGTQEPHATCHHDHMIMINTKEPGTISKVCTSCVVRHAMCRVPFTGNSASRTYEHIDVAVGSWQHESLTKLCMVYGVLCMGMVVVSCLVYHGSAHQTIGQWHSAHVRSSNCQVHVIVTKLQAPIRNMSARAASSKQHQLWVDGWWLWVGC